MIAAVFTVCGVGSFMLMRTGVLEKILAQSPEGRQYLANEPTFQLIKSNDGFRLFMDVSTVLGAVGAVVLITSAIGLLLTKPWARLVTRAYGVYRIAFVMLTLFVNYVLVIGPNMAQSSGQARQEALLGLAIAGLTSLAIIGYWVLVIVLMTRPRVVAVFDGSSADGDDGFDTVPDEPWNA
jgi:hypothetical protein